MAQTKMMVFNAILMGDQAILAQGDTFSSYIVGKPIEMKRITVGVKRRTATQFMLRQPPQPLLEAPNLLPRLISIQPQAGMNIFVKIF